MKKRGTTLSGHVNPDYPARRGGVSIPYTQ